MKILGISGAFGHDSAAAIVADGRIVTACEEERFTRTKRALRQPAAHSVQACLDTAGLELRDIDCIALGWDPTLGPDDHRLEESLSQLMTSARFVDVELPEIEYVPHHLAHAALGFHTSGFENAAVLVADGQGEDVSTTIWFGRGASLSEQVRFPIRDSLGFFYAAMTRYLGFSPGSAGKTMGLAALGRITYDFPELQQAADGYGVANPGSTKADRMRWWLARFTEVFGPPPRRNFTMDRDMGRLGTSVKLLPHHADAAASAQAALERVLGHLADLAAGVTGSTNLVMSGGVALNCSVNGRLRSRSSRGGLFISGAVHDGGTALGAALTVAAAGGDLATPTRMRSLLLGPCFEVGSTLDLARRAGLRVAEPRVGAARLAASRMLAGDIGGWFRGPFEYGPRALGGRSIVARSDNKAVAARVNRIKCREAWRPLAPAMVPTQAAEFGFGDEGMDFMVEARWVDKVDHTAPIAGIVHVDQSVRPLVITSNDHPLADLLAEMLEVTGAGVITNTSFNTEQEPMVCSPVDALRTFLTSDLDFLVLEDAVISKP